MQHAAEGLALAMRDGCLGVRVGRLHRLVARRFERALKPVGLSLPQLEILGILMLKGPLKPTAVAEALAVERSTISRNLSLMEDRDWVSVESSPSGRTMSVEITKAGIHVLAEARTAWEHAQASVVQLLGSDSPTTIDTWVTALSQDGAS
jgi:DNA-binding MarR family transcriptional regulator